MDGPARRLEINNFLLKRECLNVDKDNHPGQSSPNVDMHFSAELTLVNVMIRATHKMAGHIDYKKLVKISFVYI